MSSQLRVTVSMLQEDGNTLFIRKTGKPSAAAKKIYQALGYRQQRGKTFW